MSLQFTKLTEAQFRKFSELIYENAGIHLKPEKRELLNTRLGKRLRALGLNSFGNYYDLVMADKSGEELILLLDCVSTNYTSFFRENAHFDFLSSHILPELVRDEKRPKKEIVIWSAACSSGEEAYTIAMVAEEFLRGVPGWTYRVLATDISTRMLEVAGRGIYAEDRIEKVPPPLLRKYFRRGVGKSAGLVKIKDALRQKVFYQRFNLMHAFPWKEEMDVIFCRNVMIYFNRSTQETLVNKFEQCLAPGGYLFIGHSESLTSISHSLKQIASTAYRKF